MGEGSPLDDSAGAPSGLPSRRTVIGAAAWSVPVIALATATPAFAASCAPGSNLTLSISATQKSKRVVVSYTAGVSGCAKVNASLTVFVYKADGTQLATATKSMTLRQAAADTGTVKLDLDTGIVAHHVTATLSSPPLSPQTASAVVA